MRQFVLAPLLILAGCSGGTSERAENQAEMLENAAEQSTPAAAEVLENQADQIREEGVTRAPGEPGSAVQEAMAKAGAVQAANTPASPVPTRTPESKQALPHGAEKGNPPPKVDTK